MPTSNLPRRTLLLTGASRGIGHATVIRFSSAGWRVITCSRHPFPEDCPWEAGPDDHMQIDLSDEPEALAPKFEELKSRLKGGPLEALVNNAGISPKGGNGERMDTLSTPIEVWHKVMQVNCLAPIQLARALFDELKQA